MTAVFTAIAFQSKTTSALAAAGPNHRLVDKQQGRPKAFLALAPKLTTLVIDPPKFELLSNKQNPFAQARYAAIVQLAVFEALSSITHRYKPYLGTITAPEDASAEAAAVEAAYQVLSAYFPAIQPTLAAAQVRWRR